MQAITIQQNFKGIVDSTLREGLQFSSANFSLAEQKKIFHFLSQIGVDYIEMGNPINQDIQRMIQEIAEEERLGQSKILAHIRNNERDLEKAIETALDGVNILCTVDEERLESFNMSLKSYTEILERNILLAKANNLEVRVSIEDFTNRPLKSALEIYRIAEHLLVNRIGIADTLGKAMNWEILEKISQLRHHISVDLEVHLHNDLGNAVSNSITALLAGANWIDTSLLGIGERTGITPLSSLLANLYIIDPTLTAKYNLSLLTEAENYVSELCQVQIPLNMITNTNNAFFHKAGIHLDALRKFGPHKYEAFPPQLIGNRRGIALNPLISGKARARDVAEFFKIYGY